MNIRLKTWLVFLLAAILGALTWVHFNLPRFSFVDLSVNRQEALTIAKDFLRDFADADPDDYLEAVVFVTEENADRYLQMTLGIREQIRFLKEHDFDLFLWLVRFYRPNEKEEYRLTVSASNGEITSYHHIIPQSASRPVTERSEAQKKIAGYLAERFGIPFEKYFLKSEFSTIYDNRTDHSFSWQRKDVNIPWSGEPDAGTAKLITGGKIAGGEILAFAENNLEIPEKFNRSLDRDKQIGRVLSSVFRIFSLLLLVGAVFIVVSRRHHVAMHLVKRFVITLAAILFFLNIADSLNMFESVKFGFRTTTSIRSQLFQYAVNLLIESFYLSVAVLLPGLAGEALHFEQFPRKKRGAFLHHILSTFTSRDMGLRIGVGYLAAVIMLGVQSAIFAFGQRYLGVWTDYTWVTRLSTSYFPFLAAFILAFEASILEEMTYRLFGISLGKLLFRRTFIAVAAAAAIWGFGHTNYLIFPMWFRGVEVTLMGFFIAWLYLRFGLITVLCTHFLFDAFWMTIGLFLGDAPPFHMYSCLFVLLLPLIIAVLAWFRNCPEKEKPMRWHLNPHQIFNLGILKHYLKTKRDPDGVAEEALRQELQSHYWDRAVIDEAFKQLEAEKEN